MGAPRFLAPEVLARITSLELLARTVVEGFISGLHRSPYTGFSTEFAEHRQYMPGDDLRYLDWKLLGRTDRYYIKKYRADTNAQCNILIDASASMRYTTTGVTKLQYAQFLGSSLAYMANKQQDAVEGDQAVRNAASGGRAHHAPRHHRGHIGFLRRPRGDHQGAPTPAVQRQRPDRLPRARQERDRFRVHRAGAARRLRDRRTDSRSARPPGRRLPQRRQRAHRTVARGRRAEQDRLRTADNRQAFGFRAVFVLGKESQAINSSARF